MAMDGKAWNKIVEQAKTHGVVALREEEEDADLVSVYIL
jgi:hypothetical protein